MTKKRSVFRRDDLELSVVRLGEGRPFVFQHGLCGAAGQLEDVFPTGIGYQCLTLECRGHGNSPAGDTKLLSIATFADDVADFIANMDVAPAIIGGISMGAAVALRIAAMRPALVKGLVLARPAWIDQSAPANLSPNLEVGRLLRDYTPEEAVRHFDSSVTAARLAQDAPDNLASLRSFFARKPIATTWALLLAIAADGPGISRDGISAIKVPTLVIGHGLDAIHPLGMARELADLISDARMVEITPKAENLDLYRSDFQSTLEHFLKEMGS